MPFFGFHNHFPAYYCRCSCEFNFLRFYNVAADFVFKNVILQFFKIFLLLWLIIDGSGDYRVIPVCSSKAPGIPFPLISTPTLKLIQRHIFSFNYKSINYHEAYEYTDM